MSSQQVFEKEIVCVQSVIGSRGYAFFRSVKYGSVFFHIADLTNNGFCEKDLVVGCSALIDIEVEASGKQHVGKIHEINFYAGQPVNQDQLITRQSKPSRKRPAFLVGAREQGRVKILKERFGFIEESGHMDLFFALSCVQINLIPFLKEGVDVCFEVEACERGIMARVTDIIWTESQITRELVDSNQKKGLYIHRVIYPTGKNILEIRDDVPGKESEHIIAKPATYAAARRRVAKAQFLHLVLNRVRETTSRQGLDRS